VRFALGREDLQGLKVAVQGLGNVGYRLCQHLHSAGARLWVADTHAPSVDRCVQAFGAQALPVERIHAAEAEVFAPCALGGVLNDRTIPELRATVVAGAANNQLAHPVHDGRLRERGVLYAPDYVINAGGIIEIHHETHGYNEARARAHLDRIGDTLRRIFETARAESRPTGEVADALAEAIFRA
jgi:leucine dehydrogenase